MDAVADDHGDQKEILVNGFDLMKLNASESEGNGDEGRKIKSRRDMKQAFIDTIQANNPVPLITVDSFITGWQQK